MKKMLASVLSVLVLMLTPGMDGYQAFAAPITAARSASAAPLTPPVAVWKVDILPAGTFLTPLNLSNPSGNPTAAPAGSTYKVGITQGADPKVALTVVPPLEASAILNPNGLSAGAAEASPAVAVQDAAVDQASGQERAKVQDAIFWDGAQAPRSIEDVRGKTFIALGADFMGREWLTRVPVSAAKELGINLIMVDEEKRRPAPGVLPVENFIDATVISHDPKDMRETVQKVVATVLERKLDVIGAQTFFNTPVELAAMLRDELRKHFPDVLGDDFKTIHAANHKHVASEALLTNAPEVAIANRKIHSADEARQAFVDLTKGWPGRHVVLKPTMSAGKIGIRTDISSPEQAAQVYTELQNYLDSYLVEHKESADLHSVVPEVMMGFQLEGPEVDVETALSAQGGYAMVVGNPRPEAFRQEKGFTLPSQLSESVQAHLVATAIVALKKGMGLNWGNSHTELIFDRNMGSKIIEFNTRMGGGELHPITEMMYNGFSLIRAGMHAMLGLPVPLPALQNYPVLLSRYLLPQNSGTVVNLDGIDELKKSPGVIHVLQRKNPGDSIIAPKDGYADDDFGYSVTTGRDYQDAMTKVLAAHSKVAATVLTAQGQTVTQNGAFGHNLSDEVVGDPRQTAAAAQPAKSAAEDRSLPATFRWYTRGWVTNSVGQEIQAVALPLFTATLFNVPTAIAISGASLLSRIAGVWLGAPIMGRFNPVRVNNAAIMTFAATGIAIAVAGWAAAAGAAPMALLFAVVAANAVVGGLVYGITRGIAENLIPRKILGRENGHKLELALNHAYQWVEISCIAAAMFIAEPMLKMLGGNMMMVISSGLIALAPLFYSRIKFAKEEPAMETAGTSASSQSQAKGPAIGLNSYLPYVFFRFMHFTLYGVLATIFAKSLFVGTNVAGTTIGLYDGGSWLFSMLAARALLPKNMGTRAWTILGAATTVAFLWSAALFHLPMLTFALGGLLGGVITINSNKWMSYYNEHLSEKKFRNLLKWMMTWSILAVVPLVAAISAIALFPAATLSMAGIYKGLSVAVTVAAGIMLLLLPDTKSEKDKKK